MMKNATKQQLAEILLCVFLSFFHFLDEVKVEVMI
jgi:hypothetical protein